MKNQNTERRKPTFPKESVENADLHKPVLNKITTTREQCTKYIFIVPLNDIFHGLIQIFTYNL